MISESPALDYDIFEDSSKRSNRPDVGDVIF